MWVQIIKYHASQPKQLKDAEKHHNPDHGHEKSKKSNSMA